MSASSSVSGIEVEDAHPADARHVGHPPDQVRERAHLGPGLGGRHAGVPPARADEVAAPGHRVLRDEVDLHGPGGDQPLGLGHHVVGGAGALLPAQARDDAKRAGAVAPLGDLQPRARARLAGALREDARVARLHDPLGGVADEHPLGVAREDVPELEHVARPEEVVDLGHLLGELPGVALREAPGDDELLAGADALVLGELEDRVDRLLLRLADEAARVDDDDLGVVGLLDDAPAVPARHAEHDLGVDPVLDASEADEVNLAIAHTRGALGSTGGPARPRGPKPYFRISFMKRSNM